MLITSGQLLPAARTWCGCGARSCGTALLHDDDAAVAFLPCRGI